MRKRNVLKWAVYAIAVLLLSILQSAPGLFPRVMGITPILVVPSVVAIAMIEGETPGALFALFGGVLWDIQAGRTFGFNALFLMVFCIAIGLLMQFLFRNTILTALLFNAVVLLVHECITWFFFVYLTGDERFGFAFLQIILPTLLYSLIFSLPFYFGARLINRNLTQTD